MSFGKIKLRPADILFSKYIRAKNKFICQRCLRFFDEGHGLQASHFWGRRHESTRFDEENVDCLCVGCHRFFTENPAAYTSWKTKQLGEKRFKMLMVRANQTKKRDDKLILLWLQKAIK